MWSQNRNLKSPLQLRQHEASELVLQPTAAGTPEPGQKNPRKARLGAQKTSALLPKRSMQALATPRQPPQHDRAPPLSLRSRAGRVTPLPDLDMVELGRQGLLSGSITSPRVSRRQATLLRSPDGALRVVSQGANPTAVVTSRGEVVRLAGGAGADVAAGDTSALAASFIIFALFALASRATST